MIRPCTGAPRSPLLAVMTKKSDKWTGAAAMAGAAVGSAALTAALLYASRRKERIEAEKAKKPPREPIETD